MTTTARRREVAMRLPTSLATLAMLGCGEGNGLSDPGGQFGETGSSTYGIPTPRPGAVWVVAWPPSAPDAEAMATWTGSLSQEVGKLLLAVPDQDGDGAEELWIGAPGWEEPLSRSATSTVEDVPYMKGRAELVVSGAFSGAHPFEGAGTAFGVRQGSFYLGLGVLGDLDGDGATEVAVGSSGAVDMSTLTGAGTQPWGSWETGAGTLGFAIAPVPDLDEDGIGEVLVSSADDVALWTGAALVAGAQDPASTRLSGTGGYPGDLVPIPDRTGDGVADVVLVHARHNVGGDQDAGIVGVYDGAALVGAPESDLADAATRIVGTGACDEVGSTVFPVGDLDGDGLVELAVQGGGGPQEEPGEPFHEPGLYVFRGAELRGVLSLDDAALRIPSGDPGLSRLNTTFPAPDLDGDGLPELVLLGGGDDGFTLEVHAGAAIDLDAGAFTDAPLATWTLPTNRVEDLQVAWLADGAGGWRLAVGLPQYLPAR